jgi:hypothetical protein
VPGHQIEPESILTGAVDLGDRAELAIAVVTRVIRVIRVIRPRPR